MNNERLIDLTMGIAVFGLAFSVWCIGVFLWVSRYLLKLRAEQKRLKIGPNVDKSQMLQLWRDLQYKEAAGRTKRKKPPVSVRLDQWAENAGFRAPFRIIASLVACLVLLVFMVIYGLSGGLWLSIASAGVFFYLFLQYAQNRTVRQASLFERQLVDGLGVASRALRAGHPLVGAFQLISEEIGDPLGRLFGTIYHQQAFGGDLRESIQNAAANVRNTEFKLFATSISVQLHSGGNLADLMDSLSSVIRDRMRLNKRIRVLTAQTQMSKSILIIMPVLSFIVLNILNPNYMEPLYTTPEGNALMVVMIVSILTGSWIMNKMIRKHLLT